MKIMVGSDHHGIQSRLNLCSYIRDLGHEVTDVGPTLENPNPVDYPDVASVVAQAVSEGKADRGILICGTGIGMSIVANKFAGVRAAPVLDSLTAEVSRRHNDLNVLCLSGDMLTADTINHLVEIWLNSDFVEGGRHSRRVSKITAIENELIAQNKKMDIS